MAALPASIAELTPEWLGRRLGWAVDDVRVEVIGTGEGFMGELARLHLRGAPGTPATVVAKLPTTDPGSRAVGAMMRVWEREHRFYADVAAQVGVRVPRIYANLADSAPEGTLCVLVMEDLAPARPADQVAGATTEQAERVVDALAALHGTWWDRPELDQWTWMPRVDDPMSGAVVPMFEAGWPGFQDRYRGVLPDRALRWAERFVHQVPALIARYGSDPVTLCHGDARLDNIFFPAAGDGGGEVAWVDWQLSLRSPGGADLVYFLVTNLTPEQRRDLERPLLDRYASGMAARGVPASVTDPDATWLGYREGILFWCVAMAGSILTLNPGNDRGAQLFDALVTRLYTAADDLDAGAVIP